MSKEDFLAQLDADRQRLLQAIEGLSAEEMTAAPAVGEWTVKDILGHIAAWEWEAVKAVEQTLAGQRPDLLDIEDVDAWNAAQVAAWRTRPLEDVLAELHRSRQALVAAIGRLDEAQFEAADAFPQLEGRSLHQLLDWKHDRHHAVDLEAWRARSRE